MNRLDEIKKSREKLFEGKRSQTSSVGNSSSRSRSSVSRLSETKDKTGKKKLKPLSQFRVISKSRMNESNSDAGEEEIKS
jgi:hypothetical protein